jgi:hypothetical protein
MSDSINALIGAQHNASVIDALAHPAVVNPLAGIQAGTDAAKADYSIRELASHLAWGEALKKNTDPETGNINYPGAQRDFAADRRSAPGMASAATMASPMQNDQISRAHMLLGMIHGAVGGLPANATRADLNATFDRLEAAGAPNIAQERALIPQNDAEIPAYVRQLNLAAAGAVDQFHARVGTPTTVNQGGAVVGTTQAPPDQGGGLRPPAGVAYPFGMTAEQWNEPVQGYVNPDTNQPEAVTRGQLMQRMKLAPPGNWGMVPPVPAAVPAQPPAGAPAAAPGAPAAASAPGAKPPVAPAPGGTTAPAPVTSTTVPTGPRPDDVARWKASSDLYARDKEATTNYQARLFPLAQVQSILSSGDVTTGQGADALNRAKSFLMTAGSNLGFDMSKLANVKDYDELAKYMQQYVNAQGMSARSDQALASAITGNPSSHLNTLANTEVVKPLIAMERMKMLAMQDFESQKGWHPNDYTTFLAKWQETHDPRAFMADMLGKDQRTKMLAGMTAAERTRFGNTLTLVEHAPGIMTLATMPR